MGWFEIHPENYMGAGGLPHYFLSAIREHYPISMHGVGLSLGSADGINQAHLAALAKVVKRHTPAQVSEHLAWSRAGDTFLNDLLPLPYTEEFLTLVARNIDQTQEALGQRILLENPSLYLNFDNHTLAETQFLGELVKKTGCGLLLDINNVYVSTHNQHRDPKTYIDHYPLAAIGEIHLAGHAHNRIGKETVLIDDHGSAISDPVWDLFAYTLEKMSGPAPVLIEWDTDIPTLEVLLAEAEKAKHLINDMQTAPTL